MRAELFALVRRPTAWTFVAITPAYTLLNGYLMQYLLFKTANPGTFANLSADQILPTMLPANFVTVALDDLGSSPNYDGTVPLLLLGASSQAATGAAAPSAPLSSKAPAAAAPSPGKRWRSCCCSPAASPPPSRSPLWRRPSSPSPMVVPRQPRSRPE